MTPPSPPRPNLKEIQQFVKDLRDPVNQEYGGFNARAADLIDSLLSERDEARAALEPFDDWSLAHFDNLPDNYILQVELVSAVVRRHERATLGELRRVRTARAMRGNAE